MNNIITLGESGDGGVALGLERLLETRLLVQAMSGAGKSWLIRRLCEQTYGQVQQIILDLEGDFVTLREQFPDYVIAGQGGDIACSPKIAPRLAREINGLGVSLIADLSELEAFERVRFVKLFLETLIDLPRDKWRPALVIVDEAHHFCPEKGQAESARAVVDLSARGRKRGLCAVLATQRLAKLHKDATAELTNKLIGRTVQDIDRTRASDELGFRTKEDALSLRDLGDGEFWGFGPALLSQKELDIQPLRAITRLKVGDVISRHPTAGSRQLVAPPAPTAKMRKVLGKLVDLPAEAEREIKDLSAAKVEVSRLMRELAAERRKKPGDNITTAKTTCGHAETIKALERDLRTAQGDVQRLQGERFTWSEALETANRQLSGIQGALTGMAANVSAMAKGTVPVKVGKFPAWPASAKPKVVTTPAHPATFENTLVDSEAARDKAAASFMRQTARSTPEGMKRAHSETLAAAATLEAFGLEEVPIPAVAALAKRAMGGGFQNVITDLANMGLLVRNRAGVVTLTDAGRAAAEIEPIADGEDLRRRWSEACSNSARQVLDVLIGRWPDPVPITELAERTGRAMGGGFQNLVGELVTKHAATRPRPGMARAADGLFPDRAA